MKEQQKLIIWNRLIQVPQIITTEVIQQYHNPLTQRHQEIKRTTEIILKIFYFLYIQKKVEEYIQNYNKYNKNKTSYHKLYKKMQNIEILNKIWKSITIDFIQGLPQFKELITEAVYTDIIIVVNQLIKYIILQLTLKNITAEQYIKLILKKVFS